MQQNENDFSKVLVNKKFPVLIGNPVFNKEPMHGLIPGDKILSIGSRTGIRGGKKSSSCRVTNFEHPAEYCGTIFIDEYFYMAFRQFEQYNGKNVYLIYATDHNYPELILQDFKTSSILIHKAEFKKA